MVHTHRLNQRRNLWMALPTLILLFIFSLYPFFYLLGLSLTNSTLARPFQEFIGFANYQRALRDATFSTSLENTLVFAFVTTGLQMLLGFSLALFFYRSVRSGRYLRTLALFPFIAPPVAVAMIWRLIYNPTAGLLNHYLRQFGLTNAPIAFLGDANYALLSLIAIDVWQWTPFVFLLALAALQSLPGDVYEAAAVDGASALQAFRHITLPLISPALIVILMIRLIGAFKVFDMVYMLTGGGPHTATQVATHYIYRTAFSRFQIGYAASLTILLLIGLVVIVTALTVFLGYIRRRYE